ncbi:galactose-specific lectin nattectin-like, partial [Asterias rubens]|uniref:galactose-specific lectin nattectin-like n=1 Tax=Asterias rubens TaxID=7604 RepID=UPI001455693F
LFILYTIGYSQANQACPASNIIASSSCPPTWKQSGGNCYKTTKPLTWFQAKEECAQMGGFMTAPHSKSDLQFLQTFEWYFWINCNDLQKEGEWECKDGTTVVNYLEWGEGQPSNYRGSEHCAEARPSTQGWNDISCYVSKPAICKSEMPTLHL